MAEQPGGDVPSELRPMEGRVLDGRFRLDEKVAEGGMGVVYRARQLNVDRDVAVKVLKDHRAADPEHVRRFQQEARVISQLRSPHTVTLIDFGEMDDGLFIVMELLEGETLDRRLRRGALTPEAAARVMGDIASSVAEAHGAGIVHRDLKPSNVMLTEVPGETSFVRVLDFGLAALTDGEQEHALAGTPHYLAPELIHGEKPTPRADVYAMGVMLVELLTGAAPFARDDTETTLRAHIEQTPATLAELAPELELSGAVQALVSRCLAKSKRLRPRDAAAFRRALVNAFEMETSRSSLSSLESAAPAEAANDTKATLPSTVSLSRVRIPMRGAGRWPWAVGALGAAVAAWGLITMTRDEPVPASRVDASSPGVASPVAPTATGSAVDPSRDMSADELPSEADVLVHTIPDRATIWLGADRVGETPMTLSLPVGNAVTIRLSLQGYPDAEFTLRPTPGQKLRHVFEAKPTSAAPSPTPRPIAPAQPSPRPANSALRKKMDRFLD